MAGFISEWWPESNRNGGRHQIGIPGRIASEFALCCSMPQFEDDRSAVIASGADAAMADQGVSLFLSCVSDDPRVSQRIAPCADAAQRRGQNPGGL